jgi:hypothetical protein
MGGICNLLQPTDEVQHQADHESTRGYTVLPCNRHQRVGCFFSAIGRQREKALKYEKFAKEVWNQRKNKSARRSTNGA